MGVKLEVASLVSKGKIVLSEFRLGGVESQLVPSQPALVAQHGGGVDGRAGHVEVQVAAQVHIIPLVTGLQFGTLLAKELKGNFLYMFKESVWSLEPGRVFSPGVWHK